MNPEGRLYAALDGRQPEKVPTLSLFADPNIANQVLGIKPSPILKFIESGPGSRYLDRRGPAVSRWFDLGVLFFYSQVALVNYRLGFDAVLLAYWRFTIRNHRELEDAFGRLFDIVDDGYGNPYMMYREGGIESPDEWRGYPRPGIARYASAGAWVYRLMRLVWNRKIAIVPWVAPGLWENSWQPMGLPRFVAAMRKDPSFVREVAGYFTALSVAQIDAYCRAGARVVGVGDDLGYKSGPMISPDRLEEFYGDGYRQITATAHRHGSKIFIHSCGNSTALLEKFIEWGFDGAHAFEPTADNDLAEARRIVGDRLCIIGNVDVTHTLVDADRSEVESEVAKAMEDTAGGGFILAPAHTHSDINIDNVRWMLEAASNARPGQSNNSE
jgi:hypothetical protein